MLNLAVTQNTGIAIDNFDLLGGVALLKYTA